MTNLNLNHWVLESPYSRYDLGFINSNHAKVQFKALNDRTFDKGTIDDTPDFSGEESHNKGCTTKSVQLSKSEQLTFAQLIHPKQWPRISSVCLHASGQKVIKNPELALTLDALFEIISIQHPVKIKNRESISTFQLIKGSLAGSKVQLRRQKRESFLYKWYFIYPQYSSGFEKTYASLVPILSTHKLANKNNKKFKRLPPFGPRSTAGLGVNELFIFQELDRTDYEAFSLVAGFDIVLNF